MSVMQPTRFYVRNCPMYDSVMGEAGGLLCIYTGYARRHVLKGRDKELLMDGTGRAVLPNGDVYEGDCRLGMFEGLGTLRYANGDLYDGQWENHLRHGYGVLEYADGRSYTGLFREGEKSGAGDEFGSKITFSGSYKDGEASGIGRLTNSETGEIIDGVFREGVPNGPCTVLYPNGDHYYGTFRNGVPHGKGRYVVSDTGDTFFEEFDDGRCILGVLGNDESTPSQNALGCSDAFIAHGRNCHIQYKSTGDEYIGGWLRCEVGNRNRRGKRHGHGTLIDKVTGAVYVGTFENDKREGAGVLTFPSVPEGEEQNQERILVYDGEFHDDRPHGKATVTYANGGVKEQFFSKGVPHGISHEQRPEGERSFPNEMSSRMYDSATGPEGHLVDYHTRAVLE